FSGYSDIEIGGGEGNISDDDRYTALIGVRSGGVDVIVYDIANDKVLSTKRYDGYSGPWGDVDAAHISRSGRYVVVSVKKPKMAYDLYDAQNMNLLRRLVDGQIGHSDMGYAMEGQEAMITMGIYGQPVVHSIRLSDGVRREEVPAAYMAWNEHISCRNNLRPGWCYISTYYGTARQSAYMYRQIYAVKLDGSGTVQRFSPSAFADNPSDQQYLRQAHAVPSRDGRLVLFASDWRNGSSGASIHTYVAGMNVD